MSTAIAYLVINDDVTLEVLTPFVLADVTNAQASLSFRGQFLGDIALVLIHTICNVSLFH